MLYAIDETFRTDDSLGELPYCPPIALGRFKKAVVSMSDRITEWTHEYVVGWRRDEREESIGTQEENRLGLAAERLGLQIISTPRRKSGAGIEGVSPPKRKLSYDLR